MGLGQTLFHLRLQVKPDTPLRSHITHIHSSSTFYLQSHVVIPGDNTLTQSTTAMNTSRKTNVDALVVGNSPSTKIVRPENSLSNDPEIPVFPEYYDPEFPISRIAPSPEEEIFRSFVSSRLPQLKASPALRERIRLAVENSCRWPEQPYFLPFLFASPESTQIAPAIFLSF